MSTQTETYRGLRSIGASVFILFPALIAAEAMARNNIRDAFFFRLSRRSWPDD